MEPVEERNGIIINNKNIVIVEGKNEEYSLPVILKKISRNDIQIIPANGKNNFRKTLNAIKVSTGYSNVEFLGIIGDADSDPTAAFQSICSAFKSSGFPNIPSKPGEIAQGEPSISILVLPEDAPGELEDVCLKSVGNDAGFACVEAFFNCISSSGCDSPRKMAKAKLQAFLSSRPEVDSRISVALKNGYIDWQHKAFESLIAFFNSVPE